MGINQAADDARPVDGFDLQDVLFIGVIVFACSIFGIYTAPPGVLAAFWPANAVLVGLMLRPRHPPTPLHWLVAAGAYMLADLYMQHGWPKSAMLTATNLMGVSVCYFLLSRMNPEYQSLRHPRSMLRFVLVVVSGAAAAGAVGIFIHPVLFGGSPSHGFAFWFSTELVNYIAILPVMLTMPDVRRWLTEHKRRADWSSWRVEQLAPLAAFAASLWLGTQLGGPGVIPYPIPAMLWCALTYSLFATAGITLFFSLWTLLAISSGTLVIGANFDSQQAIMSLRVGVTLTALAPLTVASVMVARDELLARLKYAASHDALTQVLNRGGFLTCAEALLATPQLHRRPVAVMMMDIDFFKKVNDSYGHAAGDVVLTNFARVAEAGLRSGDLLGRLGGEEFAVLLPGCGAEDARLIAQRICDAFARHAVAVGGSQSLNSTVSIGVCCLPGSGTPIETMLSSADTALYKAKHSGRNRVEL
ncbi:MULTISPECIES: GGDEF domain-containing protein [unclassified Janthinobacterium]|uniref:GGDEF domain-containing protein n=1 Tax=unclassified Janthinobacterium TaxID=2610881 RepID=UPI0003489269|nr:MULTISPECIES: GGDEF domain-containing protein [unclassified Janthinobacterium]MEC5160586.1 diguanylate cyclase (GGDEF)-like protein [Janthinobacterium sp. CG_S6]